MNAHANPARNERVLLRCARQLLKKLESPPRAASLGLSDGVRQLSLRHDFLRRHWRLLNEAERRGWLLAAAKLRDTLLREVAQVRDRAADLLTRDAAVSPTTRPGAAASPDRLFYTLIGELRQLHEEFQSVSLDPKGQSLSVDTEPLVLADIALGPFRLELPIGALRAQRDDHAFRCVALEPNPAASSEDVTHPHVRGERLCAGEATAPIALALSQGRICDAFCLVRAVLSHYNAQSPYVALEAWCGVRCDDCGDLAARETLYGCEHCGSDVCDVCSGCCERCQHICCSGCLVADRKSRRLCCPDCLCGCAACRRAVDADDFHPESGLCPECRAEQEQDALIPNEEVPHGDPKTAVLPARPLHVAAALPSVAFSSVAAAHHL